MPKIDAQEKLFFSLLGKEMTEEELIDIFPVAKAELDGHDVENKVLKIELNDTNRPDLWGHYGIAREFAAIAGRGDGRRRQCHHARPTCRLWH